MKTNESRAAATASSAPRNGTLRDIGAAALLAGLVLWGVACVVALGALEAGGSSSAAGLMMLGIGMIGGLVLIAVGQSILVLVDVDES